MGAFLDTVPRRDSDPRRQRINLAAGVPRDRDGVGMVPGGEQGTGAVQQRLPRAGDYYLTVTAGIELAWSRGTAVMRTTWPCVQSRRGIFLMARTNSFGHGRE